jgi:UDP-glucose:(heptosyl)LPS alpha-1,3-glucosyltransferase
MIAQGFQSDLGLSADRIRVVPYQINLSRFSPESISPLRMKARAALQLDSSHIAVVCAAQNFRRKGVRILIEAAAVLQSQGRRFSVLIAGLTARHAAPYQRLARRLGCEQRVRFVGHTERIEELYAAADVFCLPTFFDPCAIASIEAMACGLPSITSRYNGASELMTPGVDGIVVAEPQDARCLAAAMEPLFDPKARVSMGAAAMQTARRISENHGANAMARVLEELAELKRQETPPKAAPAPIKEPQHSLTSAQ